MRTFILFRIIETTSDEDNDEYEKNAGFPKL